MRFTSAREALFGLSQLGVHVLAEDRPSKKPGFKTSGRSHLWALYGVSG